MDKKEEFRLFVKKNANLASYVKDGTMTWQKFYEIYDLYGEDNDVWKEYQNKSTKNNMSIQNLVKSIDISKLEEQLQNASKTLDLISELTKKDPVSNVTNSVSPRPITKLFKD